MIIRPYKITDYLQVCDLLLKNDVEPPQEPSDLNGVGLVAENQGEIIGFIWALVGSSTQAYVDYLVADKDYSLLGWNLVKIMDVTLKALGVKRYTFFIEPDNTKMSKVVLHETNRVQQLRDLKFYRREIA